MLQRINISERWNVVVYSICNQEFTRLLNVRRWGLELWRICAFKPLQGTCFCADSRSTHGQKQYDLYGLVRKRPWIGQHVRLFWKQTHFQYSFSQLSAGCMAMRRCIRLWLGKMKKHNMIKVTVSPNDHTTVQLLSQFSQCYRLFEISQNPSIWEASRVTKISSKAGQYINSLSLSWYHTTCHLRFWILFYHDLA